MARALARVLDVKHEANYGINFVTAEKATRALRHAASLVETAAIVFDR